MTALLLSLLVLASGLLYRSRWVRTSTVLALVTGCLFIATASGFIPNLLLERLQAQYVIAQPYRWATENIIIVLGGGTTPVPGQAPEAELFAMARIVKTAQVYHDCHFAGRHCRVLISGGDAQRHGVTEAATYREQLEALGVAVPDLLLESGSTTTWQNARLVAEQLRPLHLDAGPDVRMVLVTSGYHMQRSLLYFRHFGLDPVPARADYLAARARPGLTGYNLLLTDVALHELAGIARYDLYERFGWNASGTGLAQPQP